MIYTALEVARHIIKYANDKGLPCSNLKLQKILYFVQAEFLVVKNQKCFEDKILACDFGSLVEDVYDEYRIFGGCNITDQEMYLKNIKGFDYKDNEIDEEDKKLIDGVVDETIVYSNSRLGDFIHSQAPWQEAYTPFYKQEITCESLKNFFKEGEIIMYDLEIFKDDIGVTYDFVKYTKYEDWKETMSHKGCTKDNLQKMAELYETSIEKDKKENKVSKFAIKRVTYDKSSALAYLLASGEYSNNVGKNIAVYKDSDFLNYKEFDVVGINIRNDKLWLTTDLKTSNMKYRTYFLIDNKDAIDMFYKFPVSNEHLVEDLIRFIIRQCEVEKLVLEAFDDIEHGRETDVYPKEINRDYEQ